MTPDDFAAHVRTRVADLAALDPDRRLFGARAHGYEFGAPWSEEALAAFETQHGVRLPPHYRAYLRQLGNGGAGPSYGILPLAGGDSEDLTVYGSLAHPFAYEAAHNPAPPSPDDEDEDEDEDRMLAYYEAFDLRGALWICHHGCAARSFLVVAGPCHGQVWADLIADEGGFAPELAPSGARHTFETWYLAWLDRAAKELRA